VSHVEKDFLFLLNFESPPPKLGMGIKHSQLGKVLNILNLEHGLYNAKGGTTLVKMCWRLEYMSRSLIRPW